MPRVPVHRPAGPRPPSLVEAWCRRFALACRERGVRLTHQRLAVYRALAGDTGHPTADGVHAHLRDSMPSLSLATVYRILESLEAAGLIRRVSATGGGVRFDANTAPHQHLVCRGCGRMADHDDPALAALAAPARAPAGFRPEELDIRILGLCAACAAGRGARVPSRKPGRPVASPV